MHSILFHSKCVHVCVLVRGDTPLGAASSMRNRVNTEAQRLCTVADHVPAADSGRGVLSLADALIARRLYDAAEDVCVAPIIFYVGFTCMLVDLLLSDLPSACHSCLLYTSPSPRDRG